MTESTNRWAADDHARAYLERANRVVNRQHGEEMVKSLLPPDAARVLDLGTGDGRLLATLKEAVPNATAVGLDFSAVMLDTVRLRFAGDESVAIVEHDLSNPLPDLGAFDVIASSFVIHHVPDERKRALYREIFDLLAPGGVFCNLEHVAPVSGRAHQRWMDAMNRTLADEDPSNLLTRMETQLDWLREIGYTDVDCYWKWHEFAVLAGWKPA